MKNKLIKALNEIMFKELSQITNLKIKALTKDTCFDDILNLHNSIYKIDTTKLSNTVINHINEVLLILSDLKELETNPNELSLFSNISKETQKNIKELQEKFIKNFEGTETTKEVMDILRDLSKESYIVGGAVRDACRGIKPKDVDFCTDTDMSVLVKEFSKKGFKCDEVGLQFLVLVVSKNGESFEVANFRSDKNNKGGQKGTMKEDSERRDFSVGSGYIRINDSKLFDPNGMFVDDILSNTLRFVGKPDDRLKEDYIRGYRFMRFLGRGFIPDKKSLKAVRQHWDIIHKECNPERIRLEIEKMVNL